jgi:hypothetical protein
MKKLVLITALVLLAAAHASADTREIVLAWDPNTEPDIDAYFIYYGTKKGGPYTVRSPEILHPVTEYRVQLTGEPLQTYYFVATAVDTSGNESGFSNEVYYTFPAPPDTTPPPPPRGLRAWLVRIVQALLDWMRHDRLRIMDG